MVILSAVRMNIEYLCANPFAYKNSNWKNQLFHRGWNKDIKDEMELEN